jgi:uncharacterized membrane protein (DUF373 family)
VARARADERPEDDAPRYIRAGNAVLALAEDVIYVGIAAVLAVSAFALLGSAALSLKDLADESASETVLHVLDRLLLVFIVAELLFAVRVILGRREVVAEPFLIVGILASIKEIIVLSVEAAELLGEGERFTHAIIEVGVLGVLVVLLAGAAIMLRVKENAPREGDRAAETDAPAKGAASD